MISFKEKGDFSKVTKYLKRNVKGAHAKVLTKYAEQGVDALKSATPIDTGLTASSWYYEIEYRDQITVIRFCNSNIVKYIPIAIILQYGHATRNGGWVEGRDYINPAIQPIFDKIANDAWKEVTEL